MKTFLQFIQEARKNPDKNPKLSAYEYLKPYSKRDDIFISFTALEKIGINPQSKYNTPLGIYTYPLKQVWDEYYIDRYKSMKPLPFASEMPYINIIQAKSSTGFVDDMSKYSSKDFDRDMDKLKKMLGNNELFNDIQEYAIRTADNFHKSPMGLFWNITRVISAQYQTEFDLKGKPGFAWNYLLRKLGYTGFNDKRGQGVIHSAEPMQAVFLTSDAFKVIDRIPNKDYPYSTKEEKIEYFFPGIISAFKGAKFNIIDKSRSPKDLDIHLIITGGKTTRWRGFNQHFVKERLMAMGSLTLEFQDCQLMGCAPSPAKYINCKFIGCGQVEIIGSTTINKCQFISCIINRIKMNSGSDTDNYFEDCKFADCENLDISNTFKNCSGKGIPFKAIILSEKFNQRVVLIMNTLSFDELNEIEKQAITYDVFKLIAQNDSKKKLKKMKELEDEELSKEKENIEKIAKMLGL